MSQTVRFPSTTFFQRLAERMRADEPAFRRIGPLDCTMVVKVELAPGRSAFYEVAFEAFRVKSIRSLERIEEAAPRHFVIEGSLETWREMIENIRRHGAADLEHTLNYLTLRDEPMRVGGTDQLETDAFYRYNQTLQRFFDGSAQVKTGYPLPGSTRGAREIARAS
jgi:hypothetical protein